MKVIAVRDWANKLVNVYGEGELIEDQVPDQKPWSDWNTSNPCIKITEGINKGKIVWDLQCYWGEIESIKETLLKQAGKIEYVKLEEEIPAKKLSKDDKVY